MEENKQALTIKWIVLPKKMIKFIEAEDKTYKLADNVVSQIEELIKNKIITLPGNSIPVNVIINGENVTFISIRDNSVKVEEKKVEEKPIEKKEEKTEVVTPKAETNYKSYTVLGYSKDRKWWLFKEIGEKVWVGVDEKVSMQNINKDDKIELVLETRKTTYKDKEREIQFITAIKVIESKKQEISQDSNPKSEQVSKKSSYRDENAMDKRTALMVAKDIVVAYINSKAEIVNTEVKVGELTKRLTKVCFDALNSI